MSGDEWDEERRARFCLAHVVEPGDPRTAADVALHGAVRVWADLLQPDSRSRWAPRARDFRYGDARHRTSMCRSAFLVPGDPQWPSGLDDLAHAGEVNKRAGTPYGLWVQGSSEHLASPARAVSMVGCRASTAYGEQVAAEMAFDLATRGVAVVSGAAYGIDGAAHRGALGARRQPPRAAPTIAVLAGGLDQAYPAGHRQLLQHIASQGAVVSEVPPGQRPTRLRFLARNRMIAAMSAATIVVQAHVRSGARNTATWAGRCGRPVLAVPGPVTDSASATPHLLLRNHEAELATCAADVLEMIAPIGQDTLCDPVEEPSVLDQLSPAEREVFEAFPARGWRSTEDLVVAAALAVPHCLVALEALAARGLVEPGTEGRWRLTHLGPRNL